MTRQIRMIIFVGLLLGLLAVLLIWRVTHEDEVITSPSRPADTSPLSASPLATPTIGAFVSPLPLPPTAPPPITTATLEAIRAARATATPPSSSGTRPPYIAPATWRSWAVRILALAGVLAYISLRLYRGQKT